VLYGNKYFIILVPDSEKVDWKEGVARLEIYFFYALVHLWRLCMIHNSSLQKWQRLAQKQGIYNQKGLKKADFKKKNPFLRRIFLETEQEVTCWSKPPCRQADFQLHGSIILEFFVHFVHSNYY